MGRYVIQLRVNGLTVKIPIRVDINSLMVKNGWALAYRKYSRDYIDEENEAKDKKVGMWAGKFIAPWRWRKLKR